MPATSESAESTVSTSQANGCAGVRFVFDDLRRRVPPAAAGRLPSSPNTLRPEPSGHMACRMIKGR
jgi:hypothetical protein